MVSPRGVADAELRWNHPRGIPRAEQRGADSSGLRGRAFLRSAAEGGGRGPAERGEAMTRQRDLKSIIRERQSKTGESYTAARSYVMRERTVLLGHTVFFSCAVEPRELHSFPPRLSPD